jgi:hypothetical protein
MSLVAAPRANNLNQRNTVIEIKYSNRNSAARDSSMIDARSETPVHVRTLSSGTVQEAAMLTIFMFLNCHHCLYYSC